MRLANQSEPNRIPGAARGRTVVLLAMLMPGVLPASTSPEIPRPVQWSLHGGAPHEVRRGQRLDLVLDATIEPGWHLYAMEEPEGGPMATEIGLEEGDPASLLRVSEAKPLRRTDPAFQVVTASFETAAQFTLHVRMLASAKPGAATLHVIARYQACNDRMCLPPKNHTVDVPLTIVW